MALILNSDAYCGPAETLTMPGPFRTIDQLRAANRHAGHHFFDRDTMRFFDSRIGGTVYGGRVFVTSERNHGYYPEPYDYGRWYTVRVARDDGTIADDIGGFQRYKRGAQANTDARNYARLATMGDLYVANYRATSAREGDAFDHRCHYKFGEDQPAPLVVTCGANPAHAWCERCDPAPSWACHWCHGRGYSTAPMEWVPPRWEPATVHPL